MSAEIQLDFLVIGAQKAGTTSLHEMLAEHGDIALPRTKETHFFSHTERMKNGVEWYLRQFDINEPWTLRGEIDPEYLFSRMAPANIRRMANVSKFIVILRHPLDRAFSQYQMSLRRGYEVLSFSDALLQEETRLSGGDADFARDHFSYMSRSLYTQQIRNYMDAFPEASFLFIRSDDLSGVGYIKVCEFLGIRSGHRVGGVNIRKNVASRPRSRLLRDFLYTPRGRSRIRGLFVKVIPTEYKRRAFLWLDRINQTNVGLVDSRDQGRIPRDVLLRFFDDLMRAKDLTKLDISDWIEDINRRLSSA